MPTLEDRIGNSTALVRAIQEGGFITSERTYGGERKVSQAREFKADYDTFLKSTEGKKLQDMYGEAHFDGYGVLDLGKQVVAAVIKTSQGAQYLTLNERYAGKISTYDKAFVLAHEHLHGTGVHSEQGVESRAKSYWQELWHDAVDKISSGKSYCKDKASYVCNAAKGNLYKTAEMYQRMKDTASYRQQASPTKAYA